MIKKILLWGFVAVVVALAAFAGVVALQPSEYRVERSAVMDAPPSKVFEHVNDFHHWEDWSPWAKLDPHAMATFEGADAGEGATFRWAGNADVGEGSMTILESRPSEYIQLRLDFVKPMEDTATTEFFFQPAESDPERTNVTWVMSGQNNFIGRAVCMIMDMDKMIGSQFETGLENMKAIVEAEPDEATPESPSAAATDQP